MSALDLPRLGLRSQAEVGGEERVFLGHRGIGAVQAIEDELAEEWIAGFAVAADVVLALVIHEVKMVAFRFAPEIEILAQLDVARGAEDEGAPVAPGAQAVGVEP